MGLFSVTNEESCCCVGISTLHCLFNEAFANLFYSSQEMNVEVLRS